MQATHIIHPRLIYAHLIYALHINAVHSLQKSVCIVLQYCSNVARHAMLFRQQRKLTQVKHTVAKVLYCEACFQRLLFSFGSSLFFVVDAILYRVNN